MDFAMTQKTNNVTKNFPEQHIIIWEMLKRSTLLKF